MVSCKHCTIQNSLDSTFCKRCGTVLEDADIQEATVKLNALIADGNRLFADGRTDEAMLIAENAVLSHPSCPAALSLKGMCHERLGQISEALECFDRVVELNPDSTLDRIKANDLRNLIVMRNYAHQPSAPSKMPMMAASAAALLVIAIGAFAAKASATPEVDRSKLFASNETGRADQSIKGFNAGTSLSSNPQQPNNAANTANGGMPPGTGTPNPGQATTGGTGRVEPQLPDYRGQTLPNATGGASAFGPGEITIEPIHPGPPTGGGTAPGPTQGAKEKDPEPGPVSGMVNPQPPIEQQPKEDPGIIEITPAKNSSPSLGGGRDALIHSARGLFQQGNFDGAARSYERALRSGADQASTNQRLGQCYQNLGRSGDAIAAYERAASAYEAQIASGKGDTGRLSSALDACRQAIKVLKGN